MHYGRATSSVTISNEQKQQDTAGQRLARENRLLDAVAFERVFRKATRSGDTMFTVLCRENGGQVARLGLAISKKNCPKAARRNHLKRIVRESFRRHKTALAGIDVVVMSQAAASRATNERLFDSLATHWQRCLKAAGARTEREER